MPIGTPHHHHHTHHHSHHHNKPHDVSVMTLLREHRSDTVWRIDQPTATLMDPHAAHELEHNAHERKIAQHTKDRLKLRRGGQKKPSSIETFEQQQQKQQQQRSHSPAQRSRKTRRKSTINVIKNSVKPQNLMSCDLFRSLGTAQLQSVCDHFIVRPKPLNAKIVVQGEPADKMYVLMKGEISVQIEDTHVASLFPISVFGERSLMLGGGASASCVAVNGPCIVGSLSRAAFNHAVGNELGQELEDFTRLRAIVQDAKNEQNYQVAHQSEHEKLMMSAMAMLRKILRKKIGRMRAVHAKKTAKAKYHWSFVKDFAMALILVNIPCLFDLTSRHYSVLGRRIRHSIKKHKMDEVLYNKGDASLGIYILLRGTVRLTCSKHDLPNSTTDNRRLCFLHAGDCIGDLELLVDSQVQNNSTITRSCTVKFATPATTVFISEADFRWIVEQQKVAQQGQITEGENGQDIQFPNHWNTKQVIEDDTRLSMNHMSNIIHHVRSQRKSVPIKNVLQKKLQKLNFQLGKEFGSNISFLRSLLPSLDSSRMCLLATTSKNSHLPPRTEIRMNMNRETNGKKKKKNDKHHKQRHSSNHPSNQKRKDGLDSEVLWIAAGDSEITFLDSMTGVKISSAICRPGRCFGLLEKHVLSSNKTAASNSRHRHHTNHDNTTHNNNNNNHHNNTTATTTTSFERDESPNNTPQTSRTTSPFKSKEERIIPPKIVIKTLTAVDVVSLNIAHLKLLGQQTLTKLWHGCEMLKNRHANDARNNNNENEHNTQQQQHTYPKRNGRFGLLQDNVVVEIESKLMETNNKIESTTAKEARNAINGTRLVIVAKAIEEARPNSPIKIKVELLDAIHSMYHRPNPMGDPNDSDFLFANFSSPKRPSNNNNNNNNSSSNNNDRNQRNRNQRNRKPKTPGRKIKDGYLDYDGQMFVRSATRSATRPSPVISVTSMSTRNTSVQKLQPVAMEAPLPTMRYKFTQKLSGGRKTVMYPFQERE